MNKINPPIKIPEAVLTEIIYVVRERKVMLDHDLAKLYGVETKRLKEQVRRNLDRFPDDFMFELSNEEFAYLRSQFATSSWGGTSNIRNWRTGTGSRLVTKEKEKYSIARENI